MEYEFLMDQKPRNIEPPAPPKKRPGPLGGKRDRNRKERVAKLCSSALPLFLERGIERTTIEEITQNAGIAKGSFYRYFEDKEQLVSTLFTPLKNLILGAMHRCDAELAVAENDAQHTAAYTNLGLGLAQSIFQDAEVVILYLQENRGPSLGARKPVCDLAEEIANLGEKLTATAHERGLLRAFPARVSSLAVIGASERLILAHLRDENSQDASTIVAALTSMVLEGLNQPRTKD